ncbi:serine/threonine protein kinase [Ectocarpus siliculosus]|uniref:Serine/threonine protein kinase n=1 Tax=Ectocarpus siliculosus TaxID=2880 RepID=D7G4G8_ECTSI|nr:serine/threonine protein kinase [Ectocarpus siliculosus]|eukprot:CBJ33714.1 serine/threonine protein kinase [Ectocarpus siliculosus]
MLSPHGRVRQDSGRAQIIANQRAEKIRRLQNQLGCIEGNFLGQLEVHNERADAAEQQAQLAERRTRVVEARARAVDERMRVAEERAATAEERVRIAEAAMARLAEEAVERSAAGPPLMSSIGALATAPQQEAQGSPATPRLADLMRNWQQNKCRDAFVARMRDGFKLQLRAARDALAPGSGMLGAEEELGHGTFGGVYKAVCDATKTTWAIKRPMKEMDKEFLIHEMLVYSSLPAHANILGVRAIYDISHSPALALECGECDMFDALFGGRLSFPDELDCLADVVAGTRHCNDNGVVLCDLKFSNIILVHNGARYVAKVSDFGLSCAIGHNRYPRCGTPGYFPHEVSLEHTVAEPSTDAFSVGAMLAILALQPKLREENVFCHKMFLTPEEALQLPQLAQAEFDSYRERQEEIAYRTMLLPNSGFAKKVTRPAVVNTMPGTQLVS